MWLLSSPHFCLFLHLFYCVMLKSAPLQKAHKQRLVDCSLSLSINTPMSKPINHPSLPEGRQGCKLVINHPAGWTWGVIEPRFLKVKLKDAWVFWSGSLTNYLCMARLTRLPQDQWDVMGFGKLRTWVHIVRADELRYIRRIFAFSFACISIKACFWQAWWSFGTTLNSTVIVTSACPAVREKQPTRQGKEEVNLAPLPASLAQLPFLHTGPMWNKQDGTQHAFIF